MSAGFCTTADFKPFSPLRAVTTSKPAALRRMAKAAAMCLSSSTRSIFFMAKLFRGRGGTQGNNRRGGRSKSQHLRNRAKKFLRIVRLLEKTDRSELDRSFPETPKF